MGEMVGIFGTFFGKGCGGAHFLARESEEMMKNEKK
jgi:hypothetical protein